MREFPNLAAFAGFLSEVVIEVDHATHSALEQAAQIVEDEAKRVIGTYDYGWPQLALSTMEERQRQGYPADEPGLRNGDMRKSIDHDVDRHEAQVGSNDDHLVYFELGTVKQPPRSVLAGAAMHKEDEVRLLLGNKAIKALTGSKVP